MDDPNCLADEQFLAHLLVEVRRIRALFPNAIGVVTALIDEVGTLAESIQDFRDGKHRNWGRIHRNAIQVATLAMRCATEPNATSGAHPRETARGPGASGPLGRRGETATSTCPTLP